MFRLIAVLLLVLLVALQVKLWSGSGGLADVRQLERTVAAQRAENEELLRRNEALAAEVEDLKRGQAAIEERARAELGMIKPGEVLYRVIEPQPSAPPTDDEAQEPAR